AGGGTPGGAAARAERPAARRADRGHEPPRIGGADDLHAQAARREEADHPADRARHEGRDGRLRACHGARPRQEDRRRGTRRGPDGSVGDRGLSRKAGLMPLLEVRDIRTRYGSIEALKGISLTVDAGEVVTLIGSNGAGKSTTPRSISGLPPASQGTITFAGEDITRVPAHEIVSRGIALAPEGRHCFARMTVRENLELGAYRRRDGG